MNTTTKRRKPGDQTWGELTERLTLRLLMSYDIAPTQDVLAIRLDPEAKQRTLDTLRWDLIPHRAKEIRKSRKRR